MAEMTKEENANSPQDKFLWIREIIRANVISKLKGKSFPNVIDIGTNTGTLLSQLSKIIPNSRYFAFPLTQKKQPTALSNDIRLLNSHEEVRHHRYDLIMSVFDIHVLNWLEVAEFIKFIHSVADKNTTILFSDIETNTFTSKIMVKIASLFNPNLKSVISQSEAVDLIKSKGFKILDKDIYRINNVWSAWIITCEKLET